MISITVKEAQKTHRVPHLWFDKRKAPHCWIDVFEVDERVMVVLLNAKGQRYRDLDSGRPWRGLGQSLHWIMSKCSLWASSSRTNSWMTRLGYANSSGDGLATGAAQHLQLWEFQLILPLPSKSIIRYTRNLAWVYLEQFSFSSWIFIFVNKLWSYAELRF